MKKIDIKKISSWYEENHVSELNNRYLTLDILMPYLLGLNDIFDVEKIGKSYEGRDINKVVFGKGKIKIFLWTQMHGNESTGTRAFLDLLEFFKNIPAQRHCGLQFEDLVTHPQNTIANLCDFLQIEFHPAMLAPQDNTQERMTDGIHPESRMIGDMKFHRHNGISAEAANLWKEHFRLDFLCDETWEVAKLLGYEQSIADINDRMEFEI